MEVSSLQVPSFLLLMFICSKGKVVLVLERSIFNLKLKIVKTLYVKSMVGEQCLLSCKKSINKAQLMEIVQMDNCEHSPAVHPAIVNKKEK